MDPSRPNKPSSLSGLPRTRGDGPVAGLLPAQLFEASPHTRGWTPLPSVHDGRLIGFPAHAGMDPTDIGMHVYSERLPRTRGDGPVCKRCGLQVGEASPHTRGWTLSECRQPQEHGGFPAHAGMDPHGPLRQRRIVRLPRTRGDGPGDAAGRADGVSASPHTRGWTREWLQRFADCGGFPAHAGMDLVLLDGGAARKGLPRTRGDGPASAATIVESARASPHTRGWTHRQQRGPAGKPGFPAHAGMDPRGC